MARIRATTHIEAPVERVWDVLTDWEGQPRWMRDARSVTVLTPHREGLDVVVRCRTGIAAGIVVTDDMITTAWREQRLIGVLHLGRIIRGEGAFELLPAPEGTQMTWWEDVEAPLGALGERVAGRVVVPLVERVFRASLAALKHVCEQAPATS